MERTKKRSPGQVLGVMMEPPWRVFVDHLKAAHGHLQKIMEKKKISELVITSGSIEHYFSDDIRVPFRTHAFFKYFVPLSGPDHALIFRCGDERPELAVLQSDDYWHAPPWTLDELPYLDEFTVSTHSSVASSPAFRCLSEDGGGGVSRGVKGGARKGGARKVFLGPLRASLSGAISEGRDLGAGVWEINPDDVVTAISLLRMVKSPWEIACISEATRRALAGHRDVYRAFCGDDFGVDGVAESHRGGPSEYDLYRVYSSSVAELSEEHPYPPIIAMDHHSAYLHYDLRSRRASGRGRGVNLLVDAGAHYLGYCSDISRTYLRNQDGRGMTSLDGHKISSEAWGVFRSLLRELEHLQLKLCAMMTPQSGVYRKVHEAFISGLFEILLEHGLIQKIGAEVEDTMKRDLVRIFCPHGLGHMLGLQVHDVHIPPQLMSGSSQKIDGDSSQKRQRRLDTPLVPGQCWTVEPGIYFIPRLIDQGMEKYSGVLATELLSRLVPLGGIRIEDNILVRQGEALNLTRGEMARQYPQLSDVIPGGKV